MTLGLSFFAGPEVPAIVAPAVSENRDRLPGQVGEVFGLGPEGAPDPAGAQRLGLDVADTVAFPFGSGRGSNGLMSLIFWRRHRRVPGACRLSFLMRPVSSVLLPAFRWVPVRRTRNPPTLWCRTALAG
jgi:hypothetical protein